MPYTYKDNFVEANPHLVYSDEVDTAYDPTGGGGGGGEEYDIEVIATFNNEPAPEGYGFSVVEFDMTTKTLSDNPITKAKAGTILSGTAIKPEGSSADISGVTIADSASPETATFYEAPAGTIVLAGGTDTGFIMPAFKLYLIVSFTPWK